jgi:hypothetical protein
MEMKNQLKENYFCVFDNFIYIQIKEKPQYTNKN